MQKKCFPLCPTGTQGLPQGVLCVRAMAPVCSYLTQQSSVLQEGGKVSVLPFRSDCVSHQCLIPGAGGKHEGSHSAPLVEPLGAVQAAQKSRLSPSMNSARLCQLLLSALTLQSFSKAGLQKKPSHVQFKS